MKLLDKEIIYIDNHVVVVDKRANLLTQSHEGKIGLDFLVKNYLNKLLNKKNCFVHPIHRLDKCVSGLVLFAKTSKALSRLNEEMRKKRIKKFYVAVVEGIFEKKEGELKHFLKKTDFRSQVFTEKKEGAKEAVLKYKVVQEHKKRSLLEIELLTGRYHQIRAQLSFLKKPVLGDKKYNSKMFLKEIFLNCFKMQFFHPVKKNEITFFSKSYKNLVESFSAI